MNKILSLLIIIVFFSSCDQKKHSNNHEIQYEQEVLADEEIIPITRQEPTAPPPPPPSSLSKIDTSKTNEKKIIKDGSLGFNVFDIEKTKIVIDSLVKIYDSYYANENYNNSKHKLTYQLHIRIPSSNFEKFLSSLNKGNVDLLYKKIEARDVTDELFALGTRLESKKNYLIRYKQLLKKAKSVKEILDIEEHIRDLIEEIEVAEGRSEYLNDLVNYSTLHVTISELLEFTYEPKKQEKFTEKLKQSISNGWQGIISVMLILIEMWPVWLVILLLFLFWKKYRNRIKKKRL